MFKYLKNKNFIFVLLSLIVAFFFLGSGLSRNSYYNTSLSETKVHFINVGQGDSILIENPKFNVLIDSGPQSASSTVISYIHKLKIKKLDYVIATHPHEDHIGAMADILKTFQVSNFIAPKISTSTDDFATMIDVLHRKKLKITLVNECSNIELAPNHFLYFLWSGYNFTDDNLNNYSIVCKYINKNISFLFTGDAEKTVEDRLLLSNLNLKANVLKVGHHGSNSSSTAEFINQVHPEISIISCGMGNDYGHPHKNTLNNLFSTNSKIYRTDINGNIILKCDGNSLLLHNEK